MIKFAIRNLLIYFKDAATVFLSFLGEFIIVGLYILFIRKNMLTNFSQLPQADCLIDSWMIAGLLSVTSFTTCLGAYGVMIEDKARGIKKDFFTSPIKKSTLEGGYMLSATFVGIIMSLIMLLFTQFYLYKTYNLQIDRISLTRIWGILMLNTLSNCSMVHLVVSMLKTNNALATICTIFGSLLGFITGIYLPIGSLPTKVQIAVKSFPVSHSAVLIRQEIMSGPITKSFNGIDKSVLLSFEEYMGVRFKINETFLTSTTHILILISSAILFWLISTIITKIKKT